MTDSIKAIDTAIAELELPEQFYLQDLVESISRRVQRDIKFVPCSMPRGLTGFVVFGQAIHILYDAKVSPLHQIQIKLHELGHVVLNHPQSVLDPEEKSLLGTFLQTRQVYEDLAVDVILRHQYITQEERDAEVFATRMLTKLHLEMRYKDDPLSVAGLI